MVSKRFTLNSVELHNWFKNTALFFAPAALLFLLTIQAGGGFDEAFVAIKLWGLNTVIDVLRKFSAGK